MYPEIGFNTVNTKKYIIDKINEVKFSQDKIKLSIKEIYDSLIITLSTKDSKILGFRADIDALEIKEENNIIYKSTNSYMHACGHDAHTAILLYLITYLLNNPNELKGTIRCIFQTAEEGPGNGGAYYLYNEEEIKEIDFLFALHVNSELTKNSIYYKYDYIMASSTTFKIELFGKSSHITRYAEGIDVLRIGTLIYKEINEIDFDNSLIYIGKFNSGITTNIVPDYCLIEGTIRTFDNHILNKIKKSIYMILEKNCIKCQYDIYFNNGYPSLKNESTTTNLLISAAKLIDCNIYELEKPYYLSDDFSRYSKYSKICYFFLGTKKDQGIPLHSSNFDIDEESLCLGFKIYKKIISEFFRRL